MNRSKSVAVEALRTLTRSVRSSLWLSLLCLAPLAAGCAHSAAPEPPRQVVPNGLAQVAALEDFEIVSYVDVDLFTAVQTREAVESEFKSTYGRTGHPRWFFHAFDRGNLDFVVARFEPGGAQPRYVAERRLRVKRSKAAERALGVAEVLKDYERSQSVGSAFAPPGRKTFSAPRSMPKPKK